MLKFKPFLLIKKKGKCCGIILMCAVNRYCCPWLIIKADLTYSKKDESLVGKTKGDIGEEEGQSERGASQQPKKQNPSRLVKAIATNIYVSI